MALFAALGCLSSTLALDTFGQDTRAFEQSSKPLHVDSKTGAISIATTQRWMIPEVKVVIDDSVQWVAPQAEQAVVQAFGAWLSSNPNLPELTLEHTHGLKPKLDPDGVNAVMVAPIEFAGHEDDLAITIGFSDEETGEITEADIIINSRHVYSNLDTNIAGAPTVSCDGTSQAAACDYRYDLQNVMTHEVGHFYGLGEDRADRGATMYSCTSACETHKRDLSEGDRALIADLYRVPIQARAGSCAGARLAPAGPLSGGVGALLVGLLVFVRRRFAR